MSNDVGEMWELYHKDRQGKKRRNLEYSTEILRSLEIQFESKNGGVHLIVKHNGFIIDYWPSTGKFKDRKSEKYQRGIKNLVNYLKGKTK